jgi:hypothetical protein
MRKIAASAVLASATLAISATAAFAAPHFHDADSAVTSTGALAVSFDERGLGNANVDYLLTGTSSATWGCFNNGGKNPSAANKRSTSSPFTSAASFAVKNGRVVETMTTAAPTVANFCPNGQRLRLMSISYSGLTLTDDTNDVSTSVPNASRTFISG